MILVINTGSQSIKWDIFNKELKVVQSGKKEFFSRRVVDKLLKEELFKVKKLNFPIRVVAYRVVHGGRFFEPVIVDRSVLREIERFSDLAPLHNPFQLKTIKLAQEVFGRKKTHIAVFDTGFFKDLPEIVRRYPLSSELEKKFFIRKFGFHGISHKFLLLEATKILRKPLKKTNLITLHLGGGASITAIKEGKPIDTSMGFTPLEGLMMTTRSGDIDPGLVLFLVEKIGLNRVKKVLNQESGIKGISGISDFRRILESKKKASQVAFEMFVYKIRKYLGSYFFALNGKVDAVVFSGSIGAGNPKTRNLILKDLDILKKIRILAIPTNESLQIAREVFEKFWDLIF